MTRRAVAPGRSRRSPVTVSWSIPPSLDRHLDGGPRAPASRKDGLQEWLGSVGGGRMRYREPRTEQSEEESLLQTSDQGVTFQGSVPKG